MSRALTALICLAVPAVGGIFQGVGNDCLRHTDQAFYLVAGTVAPLFGLGLFVEIILVMTPVVGEAKERLDAARATTRVLLRTNVGLLLISEGAALYAVGAKSSSTFLVTCAVMPWILQLLLFVQSAYYRIGINRIGRW